MKVSNNIIERLLNERGILLADGATGSNLFDVGLQSGDAPELWNVCHPDRIAQQYQAFIDAGSDIILTNTFGGTRYRLKMHAAEDRVAELNIAGARVACEQVRKAGREIIVAGSMGPTGEIMQPTGTLSIEDATNAFEQQAHALKEGGADVFWIETMFSIEEGEAAVAAASRVGLPIVATFSIDTNGRTMMGSAPADIVSAIYERESVPYAIGANCGVGAAEIIAAIINMKHAARQQGIEPIIVAKANCGVPEYQDGKIIYSGDQVFMSEYTRLAIDTGAKIIGGCCGTTPAHVKKMRAVIDAHRKRPIPMIEMIEKKLGEVSHGAKAQLRGDLSIAGGARSARNRTRSKRRR